MYVIVVGGGKVGFGLTKQLLEQEHEVTLIEQDRRGFARVERELEHVAQLGDGSQPWVLERAGIRRADLMVAVTGDDEDNILICQMARELYGVERVIARCNHPNNLETFRLLGIEPTVSATDLILGLIEHEVPQRGVLRLIDRRQEHLEIVELQVQAGSPADGARLGDLQLPDGSLVAAVLPAGGVGRVASDDDMLRAGDEVLVALDHGLETEVGQLFSA